MILARSQGEDVDPAVLDALFAQSEQLRLLQAAQTAVLDPADPADPADPSSPAVVESAEWRQCGRGYWMLMGGLGMMGKRGNGGTN